MPAGRDDLITIADALGYQEFGVTGWSEGGPWALAAAAYIDPARLRHVSSIAPGSYGAFGDNSAAQYLSKIDALGGSLALRFKPGFRLMYATLGVTAKHFRDSFAKQIRNGVNDYDRQILLRPEIGQRLRRLVCRVLRSRFRRAGPRCRTPLPELGFRREADRAAGPPVAGTG